MSIQTTYPETCLSINCGNFGDTCKKCDYFSELTEFVAFNTKYMAYLENCNLTGHHPMRRDWFAETLQDKS